MPQSNTEENSSRFWEFYAVRYSIGAVLGALILFLLVKKNQSLSDFVFIKAGEPIDLIEVGIFLALGLLYAYLSSAPMLVLHAGRFLIPKGSNSASKSLTFILLNLITPIAFYYFSTIPSAPTLAICPFVFLASLVLSGQGAIIFNCHSKRSELFAFYKNLSINRSYAKGGFVDSYRHMREHGNAFAIVLFEIVLAMLMFATTVYMTIQNNGYSPDTFELATYLGIVIMVWITPAALIWLVACYIEQDFVSS